MLKNNCWHCSSKETSILSKNYSSNSFFKFHYYLICRKCGFIFSKNLKNKKKNQYNYYSSDSFSKLNYTDLINRSRQRSIIDIERNLNYLSELKKVININKITTAVDIGGAEGLFSEILKSNYPKIDCINIDPDKNIIKVGKKLYPNIKFIASSVEELNFKSLKKIDLITFFGGPYRLTNPQDVFNKFSSILSDEGIFFFTLPRSIENYKLQNQEAPKNIKSFFSTGLICDLDQDYINTFIKDKFKIIFNKKIRNLPFPKKIPFVILKKINKRVLKKNNLIKNKEFWKNKYYKKIKVINDFIFNESIENFLVIKKKHRIKKIALWGNSNNETLLFKNICKKLKIKIILEIITNELLYKNINKNPRNLSKIYDKKIDSLFILDLKNHKEILSQVPKRVHLNKKFKVFSLNNNNFIEKNVLINDKIVINQLFEFNVH